MTIPTGAKPAEYIGNGFSGMKTTRRVKYPDIERGARGMVIENHKWEVEKRGDAFALRFYPDIWGGVLYQPVASSEIRLLGNERLSKLVMETSTTTSKTSVGEGEDYGNVA